MSANVALLLLVVKIENCVLAELHIANDMKVIMLVCSQVVSTGHAWLKINVENNLETLWLVSG